MRTIKQLLRQPLKSLLGVILMSLAVAVLCICVGQAMATQSTKKALNERFSTVAIPSVQEDLKGAQQFIVEEELLDWLEEMAQEYPDIVQGVAPNRLLSAYIPQMQPYNNRSAAYVSRLGLDAYSDGTYTGINHYDTAMLVVELESVGEILDPTDDGLIEPTLDRWDFETSKEYSLYLDDISRQNAQIRKDNELRRTDTQGYRVTLTGKVTQAISVPDGMRDPVGMNARLTLVLPSREQIEALDLVPGQQYIVYGMDFFDEHQYLAMYMRTTKFSHISFEEFDPKLLKVPEQHEIDSYWKNKKIDVAMFYNYVPLEKWQSDRLNTVSMTLCLPINLLPFGSAGEEEEILTDGLTQTQVSYTDADGNTVTLTAEEFNSRYGIPMIAPLDGSVEEFLASDQGAQWQEALTCATVNNRAFTVLGVNEMHQLGAFALEKAKIGQGREFTAEEIQSGAKVCIIHELVAEQSGLQIGDTVTLSFYGTDYGLPYQTTIAQDRGWLRPSASLYFTTTPFTETAEYTIIGFWQGDVWPDEDENYYGFSANTVFVPYTSVQSTMDRRDSIPFVCVMLENGTIEQFHDLAKKSGWAGRFKYVDQGYSEIAVNFHNYEAMGQQIMLVGVAVYVILLLLFLLLYPSTQRKTVWTMESMGCGFFRRFCHVLVYSVTILAAATVLGGMLGTVLWERVVAALQATTESTVALQLEAGVLEKLAAGQLVPAVVLSALVSAFVALHRSLSNRR